MDGLVCLVFAVCLQEDSCRQSAEDSRKVCENRGDAEMRVHLVRCLKMNKQNSLMQCVQNYKPNNLFGFFLLYIRVCLNKPLRSKD